jgi:hypothetical protein
VDAAVAAAMAAFKRTINNGPHGVGSYNGGFQDDGLYNDGGMLNDGSSNGGGPHDDGAYNKGSLDDGLLNDEGTYDVGLIDDRGLDNYKSVVDGGLDNDAPPHRTAVPRATSDIVDASVDAAMAAFKRTINNGPHDVGSYNGGLQDNGLYNNGGMLNDGLFNGGGTHDVGLYDEGSFDNGLHDDEGTHDVVVIDDRGQDNNDKSDVDGGLDNDGGSLDDGSFDDEGPNDDGPDNGGGFLDTPPKTEYLRPPIPPRRPRQRTPARQFKFRGKRPRIDRVRARQPTHSSKITSFLHTRWYKTPQKLNHNFSPSKQAAYSRRLRVIATNMINGENSSSFVAIGPKLAECGHPNQTHIDTSSAIAGHADHKRPLP